jgi:hypothetical protein
MRGIGGRGFRPVALIVKFVAPREESSRLVGGPGFSSADAKLLSIGFSG